MNPAPDADLHSVGPQNFEWIVQTVAELAVKKAKAAPLSPVLQAQALLSGSTKEMSPKETSPKKAAKKAPKVKAKKEKSAKSETAGKIKSAKSKS
jgi:hypothetical protein